MMTYEKHCNMNDPSSFLSILHFFHDKIILIYCSNWLSQCGTKRISENVPSSEVFLYHPTVLELSSDHDLEVSWHQAHAPSLKGHGLILSPGPVNEKKLSTIKTYMTFC